MQRQMSHIPFEPVAGGYLGSHPVIKRKKLVDKYKLILFDADGTLRRCTIEGQPCPNASGEWELLPKVREQLSVFDWGSPHAGQVAFGIVSNQAGVGLGYMTEEVAYRLLQDLVEAAFGIYPSTTCIDMCPHRPDEDCRCRKPKPAMLFVHMAKWEVRPSETLYVGDMDSDCQAAEAAGCDFMWAKDFFGWKETK